MIDLRASSSGNLTQDYNYSNSSCVNTLSGMDNDWYYRWLLFSHLQQRNWQQTVATDKEDITPQNMTRGTAPSLCGLCGTSGHNVKQSPSIFARIVREVDVSLPGSLSALHLSNRIGLCDFCEGTVKKLEAATSIREKVKSTLHSVIDQVMAGDQQNLLERDTTPERILVQKSTPDRLLMQRNNEITPALQYPLKRKSPETDDRKPVNSDRFKNNLREMSKRLMVSHGNNSDEENSLVVQGQAAVVAVSPNGSGGSYTPPPSISPRPNGDTPYGLMPPQVLTEQTACARNRRKQTKPVKMAGEVVPNQTNQHRLIPSPHSPHTSLRSVSPSTLSEKSHTTVTNPSRGPTPISTTPTPPSITPPPSELSAASHQQLPPPAHSQPLMFPFSAASAAARSMADFPLYSPSLSSPNSQSSSASSTNMSSTIAAPVVSTAVPLDSARPFSYASPYAAAGIQSTANLSAQALMQSLYQKQASALLAMNSANIFGQGFAATPHKGLPFAAKVPREPSRKQSKSKSLLKPKKELKTSSPFNFAKHASAHLALATANPELMRETSELHSLMKTDKRRYCKVCSSTNHKANNGRPPQSRFLCQACNMPMCRSCIEFHRYKVLAKTAEENKPDNGSASAQLLRAVHMKDKATHNSSPAGSKGLNLTSNKSPLLAAPPSNSSLIYGSHSSTSTSSLSPAASSAASLFAQTIPQLHTASSSPFTSLLQNLPAYQPIAPAPARPTPVISPAIPTTSSNRTTDINWNQGSVTGDEPEQCDDSDEESMPLVISEEGDNACDRSEGRTTVPAATTAVPSGASMDVSTDQTDITPEVASKTVAMLLAVDEDDSERVIGGKDVNSEQSFQSSLPAPPHTASTLDFGVISAQNGDKSNNIPSISISHS